MRIQEIWNNPIVKYGAQGLLSAAIATGVDVVYPINGWVQVAIAVASFATIYLATSYNNPYQLDPAGNQPSIAPDENHNQNLGILDLSYHQLSDAPDVSHNQNLIWLDLSDNQLSVAPDVSDNQNLKVLILADNQLTVAPDVRNNQNLKWLFLSHNQLTFAPDVSNNQNLRELFLSFNQLTVAPDVGNNQNLIELGLRDNQLTVAPDVSHNQNLKALDLRDNQLTVAPDVSHNQNLEILFLSNNQLTVAPDVSHNQNLTNLFLEHNQLTYLPDSILSLRHNCEVNVENNLFTAEYIQDFEERLHQHRLTHDGQGPHVYFSILDDDPESPVLSLDEEIDSWVEEFKSNFPDVEHSEDFSSLASSMDPEVRDMFSKYLGRLRDTKDYKQGGEAKKNVILRVERMLQLANQNKEFRDALLALISQGNETCGDRVAIIFNEIEILCHFHHKQLTDEEFKALAIRAERYELVKKFALEECERLHLGDAIETILYFHLRLKDALDLPITMTEMLYPGCSGVTDEMLVEMKEKIKAIPENELLKSSTYWQERMRTLHSGTVDEINGRFTRLLFDLEDYFKLDDPQAFLESHSDLQNIFARAKEDKIQFHFDALARFIGEEREREIAHINNGLI